MRQQNSQSSSNDLWKIWTEITIEQWLQLLTEARPEHQWRVNGNRIIGRCVYHQEDTPSMHIIPEKRFAHCFGATCRKHETNPIYFIARVLKQTAYHTLRELKNRFDIKVTTETAEAFQRLEKVQATKTLIYKVCTSALHDNIMQPEAYAQPLINWLRERKIPLDVIHSCPIGILPPKNKIHDYLKIFDKAEAFEDVFQYLSKYLSTIPNTTKCEGWLCLFYFATPTELGRIKLREPSNKHNFVFVEDSVSERGVFGLNMFPELRADFDKCFLHIVEGEFDALTMITQQLVHGRNDIFVVASGGAMEDNFINLVNRYNFKGLRLIADNDDSGRYRTLDWLRSNPCPTEIFTWPKNCLAKDPDEFIRDSPDNLALFADDANYTTPFEWVKTQVDIEIQKAKTAENKYNLLIFWGRGLTNLIDQDAFTKHIESKYAISAAVIAQLLSSTTVEANFITQLETLLRSKFLFMAVDLLQNGNVDITVWSKKRRILQHLVRGKSLRSAIETETGPIDSFVDRTIGLPDFIKYDIRKDKKIERNIFLRQQMTMNYMELALSKITETLPNSKVFEHVGQGVHYLVNPNEQYEIFIVNGSKFFKGVIDKNSNTVTYEELEAPFIYNKYLFRSSNTPWSKHINSLEDLKPDSSLDVKAVFETLYEFILKCWRFRDHERDSLFLTAYAFYVTIASLFKHMIFVDITGPTHSGKSSLMWLLHGGADPRYKLCEGTTLLENYSAAGVRQFMANNRLCLLLDEFEDLDAGAQTNQKAWAVREILEMIRSVTSGAAFVRGTAGGDPIVGKLNFPLLVGGIFTMQQPQDLNRFIHIETIPQENLASPIMRLQEQFSLNEIEQMRKTLTLGLLHHAPEILSLHESVCAEFHNYATQLGIMDRQLRNYLPIVSILKYMGKNYKQFLIEYSQEKMARLAKLGGVDESADHIWDAIFYTPLPIHHFSAGTSIGMMPIINMLADRTHTDLLHSLGLGVYFLESRQWAIVIWRQVAATILRYSTAYRKLVAINKLKTIAESHPLAIAPENLSKTIIDEEIRPLVKNSLQLQKFNFTVFDLTKYNIRKADAENSTLPDVKSVPEVLDV